MNIHALRIFIAVVHHKSVTAAAESLHLSQPAVTIQVRKLEQELQTKLFAQIGRHLQLTKEGTFLYEEARRLFRLEQSIEEKFEEFKAQRHTIRIAAAYISTNYILPKVIAKFKTLYNSNFSLTLSNVETVQKQVLQYEADFGLVVQNEFKHRELHYEKLFNIPFLFITHNHHPLANKEVALAELQNYEFIYREQGSSTYDLLAATFYSQNVPLPQCGVQLQGVEESIKFVEAGYGITLAPMIAVKDKLHSDQLSQIHVKGVAPQQSLYLIYRKDETKHEFLCFLKKFYKGIIEEIPI